MQALCMKTPSFDINHLCFLFPVFLRFLHAEMDQGPVARCSGPRPRCEHRRLKEPHRIVHFSPQTDGARLNRVLDERFYCRRTV